MFDALYPDAADVALAAKVSRKPEPQPTQRFSTWSMLGAAPKGVAAGAAEATGSTADILGAFGQALATTGGSGKGMFATQTPEERKQTNEATDKLLKDGIDYNSEAGRLFRNVSADYTPDAQTTHAAEGYMFNFARVAGKAFTSAVTMGNIPGAVVAGLEEGFTQSDMLGQQGVDLATRTKLGAVTAVTNAVGFALPVAGKNWAQTGALALAGGPVSFMAQNQATREILQNADYSKLADQYDPLDPLGLALSTVLPLGFGALAMRGVKAKGPMPDGSPPPDVPPVKAPDDLVDAARVTLLRENMDATNPVRGDIAQADAHVTAYTRAMDQQAEGRPVSVMDVVPKIDQTKTIVNEPSISDSPQKWENLSSSWKNDGAATAEQVSQVNDVSIYKDTRANWNQGDDGQLIATNKNGDVVGTVFFGRREDGRLEGAVEVAPAYRRQGVATAMYDAIESMRGEKLAPAADGSNYAKAFWDNRTASNPIADWGAGLKKALDDMRAEVEKSKPKQAKAPADTAPAATKTVAEASTFNPAALATKASDLLAGGKTAGQVIGELEAGGTKVSPELQNMLVGASEFGGRINDLVDQVKALQAQRGVNAQGFDLIAQAVDNLRTGRTVEAKAPADPLEKALSDMAVRNPNALDAEIPIDFDADGKPGTRMTVRDYLDMVKREAAQDAADADLIEVAANCFLSGGM